MPPEYELKLFSPRTEERLEICDRLYEIAPAVMYWRRADPKTRGPHPVIPEEHRAEVLKLLTRWSELESQTPE